MTALGKALTFFNVLMAIVTGVLIVLVFVTRTNWRNGLEEWQKVAKASDAALAAEKQASAQKKLDLEDQKKKKEEQIAELNKQILGKDQEIAAEKARVKDAEIERGKFGQVSAAGTQEIDRLQRERNQMADQLKQLNDDKAKLTKDLVDTGSRETYYKLRSEALEKDLVSAREELASAKKRVEELRAQSPAGRGGANPIQPRLPSIETSGEVTGIAAGNLAQISLGSDNGMEPGHILQVYRLGAKASDSIYLGTLTITRTQPHAAVGTFEPAGRGKTINKGDKVDTRIVR
jgi:hypothetical protein